MDKMQALHSFWSSFGWRAYDANTVPDDVTLPYITYEAASDGFNEELSLSASLWDRSMSWANITTKEKEISASLGHGGKLVPYDGGAMWVRKRNPWAQRMGDTNDIRRIVLSITVEFSD